MSQQPHYTFEVIHILWKHACMWKYALLNFVKCTTYRVLNNNAGIYLCCSAMGVLEFIFTRLRWAACGSP